MNITHYSEVAFPDSGCYQPFRVVNVPTNAAVQAVNGDVQPSSGHFTFPSDSSFSDRFIIWRAIGQSLILEERSLVRNVSHNCLQFNFSRAPVVPGTSLLLSDGVLTLVVPTLSSVHRFYTKLVYDPIEQEGEAGESAINQLAESNHLENHDVHLLAARGHAIAAAVTHRVGETRVAYALSEGTLVVINMPSMTSEKSEEIVVGEGGLRGLGKRLIGLERSHGRALHICASQKVQPRTRRSPADFSCFYSVHSDGSIKMINADTAQIHSSEHLSKFVMGIGNEQVEEVSIRWFLSDGIEMLVVAVALRNEMHFLLARDVEGQLVRVTEVCTKRRCRLIDFGGHGVGTSQATWRVWAVWSTLQGEAEGESTRTLIEYCDLPLPGRTSQQVANAHPDWKEVKRYELESKMEDSVAGLRQCVFHREKHPFDAVQRAVQIECKGINVECPFGDWKELSKHVDSYLRSPEFDREYNCSRDKWSVPTGKDRLAEAELRFFSKLESSCRQFAESQRVPIGLVVASLHGAQLVGLVQQNRLSIVLEPCRVLLRSLPEKSRELLSHSLANSSFDNAEPGTSSDEDGGDVLYSESRRKRTRKGLPSFPSFQATSHVSKEEKDVANAIEAVVSALIKATDSGRSREKSGRTANSGADSDNANSMEVGEEEENEQENDEARESPSLSDSSGSGVAQPFGGSFTSGLIAAALDRRVRDVLELLSELSKLVKDSAFQVYEEAIRNLRLNFRLLFRQLQICCDHEKGGLVSLCGWLFSAGRLALLRQEGGDSFIPPEESDKEAVYAAYIESSTSAALRCLWPESFSQTLLKILANASNFSVLKDVSSLWPQPLPPSHANTLSFYRAIALSAGGQAKKGVEAFLEGARGLRGENRDPMLIRALLPIGAESRRRAADAEAIGIGDYYAHAIKLLNDLGHGQEVIELSHRAMEELPEGTHLDSIIATLFKRQVSCGWWAEALETVRRTKEATLRRQSLHDLLSRLLAQREWETIVWFEYESMTGLVEHFLQSQGRGSDAIQDPHPFDLLFAFHLKRLNYDKAAQVQYELSMLLRAGTQSGTVLRRRRDALATAASLLRLLPSHKRFIHIPHIENLRSGRSRQVMYTLRVDELSREWRVAASRSALLEANQSAIPPEEPSSLVEALTTAKLFDVALDLCKHLNVPADGVLFAVTTAAIHVEADAQPILPDWVGSNQRHAKQGCNSEVWSVVRGLLDACRSGWPESTGPLSSVCSAFLAHSVTIPCWLHDQFTEFDAGSYLRLLADYDEISSALRLVSVIYEEAAGKVVSVKARVLLPHTATETVLSLAQQSNNPDVVKLLNRAAESVKMYTNAVVTFERAAQFA